MANTDCSASGVTGVCRIDSYSAVYTLLEEKEDQNDFRQEFLSKFGTICVALPVLQKVFFSNFSSYSERIIIKFLR